jgi:hypothetical protein
LVTDERGRIVWLGMAAGELGVAGRIRMHLRERWKQIAFDRVWIAPAEDRITRKALEAAEGWAADAIDLRTRMPGHRWPSAAAWPELIGQAMGVAAPAASSS